MPNHTLLATRLTTIQLLQLAQHSVDTTGIPVLWMNKQGTCCYANQAAVEYSGYSATELQGMSMERIDGTFTEKNWEKIWQRLLASQKVTIESSHKSKDGVSFPIEMTFSFMPTDDIYLSEICVCHIYFRRSRKEALAANEMSTQVHELLDAGLWEKNLITGKVVYGGDWLTSLGYSAEDIAAGKILWEELIHPEDKERTLLALDDCLHGKTEIYEIEFRLRTIQNLFRWIYARGKIFAYDIADRPVRFVCIHIDISRFKDEDYALVQKSEHTRIFAYSVVHDLKNPAISIECLAQRLKEKFHELSDENKLMNCERILSSAKMITNMVDKINTYIAAKEFLISPEPFLLKEVVKICREEFSDQLNEKKIEWIEFPGHPTIKADKISLLRALRNLVENALKYGGEQLTKISIGYKNTPFFHVISVWDDGNGMTKEESEKIFEPFQRRGTAGGQGGFGLGLAIVKEIALHHKGEVWIEQNQKKGIMFCFTISKNL